MAAELMFEKQIANIKKRKIALTHLLRLDELADGEMKNGIIL